MVVFCWHFERYERIEILDGWCRIWYLPLFTTKALSTQVSNALFTSFSPSSSVSPFLSLFLSFLLEREMTSGSEFYIYWRLPVKTWEIKDIRFCLRDINLQNRKKKNICSMVCTFLTFSIIPSSPPSLSTSLSMYHFPPSLSFEMSILPYCYQKWSIGCLFTFNSTWKW